MITNDDQLEKNLQLILNFHRLLARLRVEVLPENRELYDLLVEGPIEEIRRLQEEVDEYLKA